jgi:hypothetical protein
MGKAAPGGLYHCRNWALKSLNAAANFSLQIQTSMSYVISSLAYPPLLAWSSLDSDQILSLSIGSWRDRLSLFSSAAMTLLYNLTLLLQTFL